MECWESAYLPWKTITLLKIRSTVCCLSTEDNWSHFLQWNNSWTLPGIYYKLYFPFGIWRTRLLVSARWGLRRIQKIQQCRCSASSLVVALFLEICGPLNHRTYRHRISVFGGFWRRTCTKTTSKHENNWNKMLRCAFQTSLQKLFAGLHQTWGKEWMHLSLNAVDISNTWCNIVFWFQCNLSFDK
jgi:hypothetical protein